MDLRRSRCRGHCHGRALYTWHGRALYTGGGFSCCFRDACHRRSNWEARGWVLCVCPTRNWLSFLDGEFGRSLTVISWSHLALRPPTPAPLLGLPLCGRPCGQWCPLVSEAVCSSVFLSVPQAGPGLIFKLQFFLLPAKVRGSLSWLLVSPGEGLVLLRADISDCSACHVLSCFLCVV